MTASIAYALRSGYRAVFHWLAGPSSVAPGYAIETNGRQFRLVHSATRCWAFAGSIREARKASWHWHRCGATWRPIERANAHALAEERSDDSQQRVVGGKVGG